MTKKNTPEIRFKGFSDDWEQRKLSDVIEKLSGGASIKPTDYLENGIRTIPKGAVNATGIADLSGSKYISEDFFEKNITSHVHTNNLVTSLRDLVPSAPNMGRMVRIEGDDEQFLMPQGVYKLELFEGMDEDFLISFSNSDKYRKVISAEKNGSTQVHIRNGEFLNIDINLPSEHEQKQIGAFFKQLDDTIALHQRKYEQLKQLKKAYLQVLFPEKGESVPKVRFADFQEPWEQRKLGELLTISNERNKNEKFSQDDVLAASLGTELVKKHLFYGLKSTEDSIKNYRVVNLGDVIYTKSPIKNYPNGIIRTAKTIEGIVPSLYCVYHIIANVNSSVIQAYFEDKYRLESYLNPLVNVGARNNVNITDGGLLQGMICIPSRIEEQNEIVIFLESLTNLITLHQFKAEQLQTLKKLYLKKMFV